MSGTVLEKQILIGGEWKESESGNRFEVISPGDGGVVGTVPDCTGKDALEAIEAAKEGHLALKKMSLLGRIELLRKAVEIAAKYDEEAIETLCRESGKPMSQAEAEASTISGYSFSNFHVAMNNVKSFRGLTLPNVTEDSNDKRLMVTHEPMAVAANIATFSYPSEMPNCTIPYALALGTAVICKPSRATPLSAIIIARALHEAGFPPGSINLLTGSGRSVGEQLAVSREVESITFFGQEETGDRISSLAGFKKLLMAIVSNNPLIVMDDANLEAAVESAMGGVFGHNGQSPISTRRILIHQDVYSKFAAMFRARVKQLLMADPLDPKTDVGPMNNQIVLETALAHIEDARLWGGNIVVGGVNPQGLYLEPTVIEDATPDMLVATEPTPGPIAPLMRFRTLDEAVELANRTRFGFQAGAFTSSLKNAFYLSENIKAGSVYINEATNCWDEMAPFGGVKRSGSGRMLSDWIFKELSYPKMTLFDLGKVG